MTRFRYNECLGIPYDLQGHIYFHSKRYKQLEKEEKEVIDAACQWAGGQYANALKQYVTTNKKDVAVCQRFYMSRNTLLRTVANYYKYMAQSIGK